MLAIYLVGIATGAMLGLMMPAVDTAKRPRKAADAEESSARGEQGHPSGVKRAKNVSADSETTSTRVPLTAPGPQSEDGTWTPMPSDEVSDNETHAASRTSSRTNHQRGIGKVRKMAARQAARLQKILGDRYIPQDQIREVRSRASGLSVGDQTRLIQAQEAQPVIVSENIAHWIEEYQQSFKMPTTLNNHVKSMALTETSVFEMRDGERYCTACCKFATPEHNASPIHASRCQEIMALDWLSGQRKVDGLFKPRELYKGCTPERYLTQEQMRRHWGEDIDFMSQKARQVIDQEGYVQFKFGKRHVRVPSTAIGQMPLAVVPYRGDGMYDRNHAGTGRLIWWANLPERELEQESSMADYQIQLRDPDESWWPVVALQILPELAQNPDLKWLSTCDGIYVSCIVQLAGNPVIAWATMLASWAADPNRPK